MYKEYRPNIALLPYIETYWSTNIHLDEKMNARILPDGCVDILFSFNKSKFNAFKEGLPYVIGTMTCFSDIQYQGEVEMLGIRFRPVGITAFLSTPISELTNKSIDINLIDSIFDNDFYQQLSEMNNLTLKIQYIDAYLFQILPKINIPDKRIVYATDLIRNNNGLISLINVAEKSCMSLRNFERNFKQIVGLSPKIFQKITKFNYTRKYIRYNPTQDLLSVAINCGYYDHSHLLRDFKSLSGYFPIVYRE